MTRSAPQLARLVITALAAEIPEALKRVILPLHDVDKNKSVGLIISQIISGENQTYDTRIQNNPKAVVPYTESETALFREKGIIAGDLVCSGLIPENDQHNINLWELIEQNRLCKEPASSISR